MNDDHKKSTTGSVDSSIWRIESERADPDSVDAYDYELDEALIASEPVDHRHRSRLLVYDATSRQIEHQHFENIGSFLDADDLLIFNDTRVVPARLRMRKETGGRVELFVLKPVDNANGESWTRKATGEVTFSCMTRSSSSRLAAVSVS